MKTLIEFNEYDLKYDLDILANTDFDAKCVIKDLEDIIDTHLLQQLKSFMDAVDEVKPYLHLLRDAKEGE
jgi:hypothetical protein